MLTKDIVYRDVLMKHRALGGIVKTYKYFNQTIYVIGYEN
tara:strand:+ start:319 stop:438 length:120 start_codon:yes stop_codon:yes gene_type:complete